MIGGTYHSFASELLSPLMQLEEPLPMSVPGGLGTTTISAMLLPQIPGTLNSRLPLSEATALPLHT